MGFNTRLCRIGILIYCYGIVCITDYLYLLVMKIENNDLLRVDYKGYMEPILLTACKHQATKSNAKTRSKYIRWAVIRALIQDGYPLNKITNKFNMFYKSMGYTGE